MKKQRTDIEVAKLQLNTGQLDWLPANPRQWTREDLDKTKNSITQDSDFLEDRPILVVPLDDAFVVFGGNLRTASSRDLGLKTIPAVIYVPETDADRETIKRRTILDNGSFGAWDFDALANEWDNMPLNDWGVPAWNIPTDSGDVEGLFEDAANAGKAKDLKVVVTVPAGYADNIEDIKASLTATLDEWKGCKVQ